MSAVLGVVAAARLEGGAAEFLRLCTGLVAGGHALRLVEVGRGIGLFSAPRERPAEVERQLEGLASFGVVPEPTDASALRALLAQSRRVLRVADADRRGTPALVLADAAWLMHVTDAALVLAFEEAGQLLRV